MSGIKNVLATVAGCMGTFPGCNEMTNLVGVCLANQSVDCIMCNGTSPSQGTLGLGQPFSPIDERQSSGDHAIYEPLDHATSGHTKSPCSLIINEGTKVDCNPSAVMNRR